MLLLPEGFYYLFRGNNLTVYQTSCLGFIGWNSLLRLSAVSAVFVSNALLNKQISGPLIRLPVYLRKQGNWMNRCWATVCEPCVVLDWPLKSSLVSDEFVTNISLIGPPPPWRMKLSASLNMTECPFQKWFVCVSLLLWSLAKLSEVSVVFIFNASLIAVSPIFPMLFPVCCF